MNDNDNVARPSQAAYTAAGAAIQRQTFGSQELEVRRETQSTALAERAKAEIQARYIVAIQRPRQWEDVWARLVRDCKRFSFAESAMYSVKKGKKQEGDRWVDNYVEGLTVGFAMTAMRTMGNIANDYIVTYEDDEKQIIRVSVMDLESNVTQSKDITVYKKVERSYVKDGQRVFGERQNSKGKVTYIVEATEEEVETKASAKISKAKRNLVLDVMPADLKEDCKALIKATVARGNQGDPDAAKKKLMTAFFDLGVSPDALAQYLGHPLDAIQPAELEELRGIFTAIREGETTWAEVVKDANEEAAVDSEANAFTKAAANVRDKVASAKAKRAPETPEGGS